MADRLEVYADNGLKYSGRPTQWLKRLVEFADSQELTVQFAYDPP